MHLPFSVPPFDSILYAGKYEVVRVLKLPHFEEFFKVLIVVLQFVRRLPCCTAGSDREAALIGEFDLLPDPAAAAAASVADEIETGLRNTDE
ncbi:hypothetical protein FF1_031879 [Malus domestica]